MPRIHPCITRRFHLLCRGVMSLPPDIREEFLRHVTNQADAAEQARWRAAAEAVRVLGEAAEDEAPLYRQLPLTASFVMVGWAMMAIMHAWASGDFYTLSDRFFRFIT